MMLDQTIGFVGGGQMARALARGFADASLVAPQRMVIHDPAPAAIEQFQADVAGARVLASNKALVDASNVVLLAVKPQLISDVADDIRSSVSPDTLIVSIAAGIPLMSLERALGTTRIVRVMPNTPCLVGKGASAYAAGEGATEADCRLVGQLLSAVGIAFQVDESLLDAVTGLSGSGPAFVFTIIEALSDGGVRVGLPRPTATALAVQTVLGAAELAGSAQLHPAVLRERVASPGGTTIAGLQVLEDRGVRAAMMAAVQAAAQRSFELGQSSKQEEK